MKSRSIRMTLLSGLLLTSPMLSFAAGQHLVRVPTKEEMQDHAGITRAVQQGKGTGMSHNQGVQVNASREQTAAESQVAKDKPSTGNPNWGDAALRK
jgi:hypothetical protein